MLTIVAFKYNTLPNQRHYIPTQTGATKVTYGPTHVNTHYNMIKRNLHIPFRYVLVTDQKDPLINKEIEQVPFWDDWEYYGEMGGNYRRLYIYSEEFRSIVGDRFCQMDLDMVITGDITPLLDRQDDFVYYRMRGADGLGWRMNTSVILMDTGARSFVWEKFKADPEGVAAMKNDGGVGTTDQGVANALLDLQNEKFWLQGPESGIYDMRLDFLEPNRNELPEGATIVQFPGPRDPNQKHLQYRFKWINEHYR